MNRPDPRSAVPLYHQIAESIRYDIATGARPAGTRLEPLHEAAAHWGVNLHTVRSAYRALAEQGLVETRTPFGTIVLPTSCSTGSAARSPGELLRFLETTRATARDRFGMSDRQLGDLISGKPMVPRRATGFLAVIECSDAQCEDLARQLESRWDVIAKPWRLSRRDEPPPGPMLGTYFHHNELRRRFPHRLAEMKFAAIRPDSEVLRKLLRELRRTGNSSVILCEFDELMAGNIAADLRLSLPPEEIRILTRVSSDPTSVLASRGRRTPVICPPRVWGALPVDLRTHPRVWELRYVFDSVGIESIAGELGWSRAILRSA